MKKQLKTLIGVDASRPNPVRENPSDLSSVAVKMNPSPRTIRRKYESCITKVKPKRGAGAFGICTSAMRKSFGKRAADNALAPVRRRAAKKAAATRAKRRNPVHSRTKQLRQPLIKSVSQEFNGFEYSASARTTRKFIIYVFEKDGGFHHGITFNIKNGKLQHNPHASMPEHIIAEKLFAEAKEKVRATRSNPSMDDTYKQNTLQMLFEFMHETGAWSKDVRVTHKGNSMNIHAPLLFARIFANRDYYKQIKKLASGYEVILNTEDRSVMFLKA